MKKAPSILCVIDFSKSSIQALEWAASMAEKLSAHLNISHPQRLNLLAKDNNMLSAKNKMEEEASRNFEVVAKKLFKNKTLSYDFQSEIGFIQGRVQEHVSHGNVLFVVMSKELINNNKESVDELLTHIEVPLVIVPDSAHILAIA